VAHSIWGLVVKHWLQDHYNKGCKSSKETKAQVRGILFVTTPNFGAPIAFRYIVEGIQIINFPILGDFISRGINKYGVTFDSLYELLPFSHSYSENLTKKNMCFRDASGEPMDPNIVYQPFWRDQPEVVDVFDAAVLFELGVEERFASLQNDFSQEIGNPLHYLQNKLNNARKVICKLSSFQIPPDLEGKTFYLAGRIADKENISEKKTLLWVMITSKTKSDDADYKYRSNKKNYYFYFTNGPGDRTVPVNIARYFDTPNIASRVTNAGHMEILSSNAFFEVAALIASADRLNKDNRYGAFATFLASSGSPSQSLLKDFAGVKEHINLVD